MTVWLTIAALSIGTIAIKGAGPIAHRQRRSSERLADVIALTAPSLLAALVVYETVHTDARGVTLDARAVGLATATAALLVWLRLIAVLALAAAAAGLTRALT